MPIVVEIRLVIILGAGGRVELLLGEDPGAVVGPGVAAVRPEPLVDLHAHLGEGREPIVGGGIPLSIGVGMGIKIEKSDRVVVCFFGDGASNNGVFAESINIAAVHSLPVIFLLENNCYAATTHIGETSRCEQMAQRAAAYGVETATVHGNDPMDIYDTVVSAVATCRTGAGPVMVEAMTHRFMGHHVRDSGSYVPDDIKESWKDRDPLEIMESYLMDAGYTENEIGSLNGEVETLLGEAVDFAITSPEPGESAFLASIGQYDE